MHLTSVALALCLVTFTWAVPLREARSRPHAKSGHPKSLDGTGHTSIQRSNHTIPFVSYSRTTATPSPYMTTPEPNPKYHCVGKLVTKNEMAPKYRHKKAREYHIECYEGAPPTWIKTAFQKCAQMCSAADCVAWTYQGNRDVGRCDNHGKWLEGPPLPEAWSKVALAENSTGYSHKSPPTLWSKIEPSTVEIPYTTGPHGAHITATKIIVGRDQTAQPVITPALEPRDHAPLHVSGPGRDFHRRTSRQPLDIPRLPSNDPYYTSRSLEKFRLIADGALPTGFYRDQLGKLVATPLTAEFFTEPVSTKIPDPAVVHMSLAPWDRPGHNSNAHLGPRDRKDLTPEELSKPSQREYCMAWGHTEEQCRQIMKNYVKAWGKRYRIRKEAEDTYLQLRKESDDNPDAYKPSWRAIVDDQYKHLNTSDRYINPNTSSVRNITEAEYVRLNATREHERISGHRKLLHVHKHPLNKDEHGHYGKLAPDDEVEAARHAHKAPHVYHVTKDHPLQDGYQAHRVHMKHGHEELPPQDGHHANHVHMKHERAEHPLQDGTRVQVVHPKHEHEGHSSQCTTRLHVVHTKPGQNGHSAKDGEQIDHVRFKHGSKPLPHVHDPVKHEEHAHEHTTVKHDEHLHGHAHGHTPIKTSHHGSWTDASPEQIAADMEQWEANGGPERNHHRRSLPSGYGSWTDASPEQISADMEEWEANGGPERNHYRRTLPSRYGSSEEIAADIDEWEKNVNAKIQHQRRALPSRYGSPEQIAADIKEWEANVNSKTENQRRASPSRYGTPEQIAADIEKWEADGGFESNHYRRALPSRYGTPEKIAADIEEWEANVNAKTDLQRRASPPGLDMLTGSSQYGQPLDKSMLAAEIEHYKASKLGLITGNPEDACFNDKKYIDKSEEHAPNGTSLWVNDSPIVPRSDNPALDVLTGDSHSPCFANSPKQLRYFEQAADAMEGEHHGTGIWKDDPVLGSSTTTKSVEGLPDRTQAVYPGHESVGHHHQGHNKPPSDLSATLGANAKSDTIGGAADLPSGSSIPQWSAAWPLQA